MTRPKACKWPDKRRYPNKAAAAAAAALRSLYAAGRGNPDLEAYQCVDHWHIGHSLAHFRARVRRFIKAADRRAKMRNRRR